MEMRTREHLSIIGEILATVVAGLAMLLAVCQVPPHSSHATNAPLARPIQADAQTPPQ